MNIHSKRLAKYAKASLALAVATVTTGFSDHCPGQDSSQKSESRVSKLGGDEASQILQEIQSIRTRLDRIESLLAQQSAGNTTPADSVEQQITKSGLRIYHDTPVAPLEIGATIPLGNGDHVITEFPLEISGFQYTPRSGYQGNLRFEVLAPQTVYIAMYGKEWGEGGNPSGNWQDEIVSPEELRQQGWDQFGQLSIRHSNAQYKDEPAWKLFRRNCESGESFLIRNHKYQAPLLIWKVD
jgi:hypothetical protein